MSQRKKSLKAAKLERAEKRRRARKRKRILVLFLEIIIFVSLLSVGYLMRQYEKMKTNEFGDENIWINEGAEKEGYTTVALFGGDSREGQLLSGTHADTIMVAAIDNQTKEVKIISVYRDTTFAQADNSIGKANSAYFLGGPKEAIDMLNKNLDLDITDYVTVDFKVLADVIDLLGGIEVEITEAEASEMNNYIGETAMVAGKDAIYVSEGLQKLDGVQAVTYARIRKNVGGDYARTERQRLVVEKVVDKVKKTDLGTINDIINQVVGQISTSFELSEILSLAKDVLKYNIGETSGFPFEKTDGSVEGLGSVVVPLGMLENVQELHAFLYPKESYTPSEMVESISADIAYITGYSRADYVEPQNAD